MSQASVLLIGPDHPRKKAIAQTFSQASLQFVSVCAHNEKSGEQKDSEFPLFFFDSRSPLGLSHSLALIHSKFQVANNFVIFYTIPPEKETFHASSLVEIQDYLDSNFSFWIQVTRTLLALSLSQPQPKVIFAILGDVDDQLAPLQNSCLQGFCALIDTLFSYYRNEPIDLRAIRMSNGQEAALFEQVILQLKDSTAKNSGKWVGNSKPGLLGQFFNRER